MGILEKSAFAPRDPTRRGRERRNLPSPTSMDLGRFAGGVSGGIAAKLILESFRYLIPLGPSAACVVAVGETPTRWRCLEQPDEH